jgi:transposase
MRMSRLSKSKQDWLIEHFDAPITARYAASLLGINFKTAAYYFHRLRMLICLATKNQSAFAGEIEVDANYLVDKGKANVVEVRQGVYQSHCRHKSKNTDGYNAKTN